ncbi:unnamed protein product [Polarella glacialis]|uniref:Uncharacterized protein n=1 Tax=Polarella glacialis TaxID=89957 RepID=A0A813G6A5_POLGL|nr:unnamed protein product [Polarella glacialis]
MSEIRQRKGEKTGQAPAGEDEVQSKQEVAAQITDMLEKLKPKPKIGLTNAAKQFKDELAKDPFNLQHIFDLGKAYGADQQWDKCANVMLRGFKRAGEMEHPEDRFEFLVVLCQASLNIRKYRQALTVMNDIKEPEELESKSGLESLRCQVYCFNGELAKGMKAFNNAICGEEFDKAVALWAGCSAALKKAGARAVTKSTLEGLARTDQEKARLEAVEKLADLKDAYLSVEEKPQASLNFYRMALIAGMVVLTVVFVYFLWLMEARSLESWKMRK